MNYPVYARNPFNASNRDENMAHARRSAKEGQAHRGRAVAPGRFCDDKLEDLPGLLNASADNS